MATTLTNILISKDLKCKIDISITDSRREPRSGTAELHTAVAMNAAQGWSRQVRSGHLDLKYKDYLFNHKDHGLSFFLVSESDALSHPKFNAHHASLELSPCHSWLRCHVRCACCPSANGPGCPAETTGQ